VELTNQIPVDMSIKMEVVLVSALLKQHFQEYLWIIGLCCCRNCTRCAS